MKKGTLSLLLTALLVVGAVGAVPLSGLAQPVPAIDPGNAPHAIDGQDANATTTAGNDTDQTDDVAPGAMLSGVVGVQSAELDGEMDRRSFGLRIARAASNESKAGVVADELADVEERLATLEQRKEELERARENGTIGNATFDAEMAELTARTSTVRHLADQSEAAVRGLPADLLESKGIDATAIRTLKQNASELTGPEVAAIARSIAGPGVGQSLAGDRAPGLDDRAPGPGDRGSGPGDRASEPGNAPVDVGPDAKDGTTTGNAPTDVGGDRSVGGGVDGGPGTGDDAPDDEEETDTSSED